MQANHQWDAIARLFEETFQKLIDAGAEAIAFCANTPHKIADEVSRVISVPILHIVDSTAKAIHQDGLKTVGLLGTKFTMTDPFFDRLGRFQIRTVIPNDSSVAKLYT
jgi:aspartate racemase